MKRTILRKNGVFPIKLNDLVKEAGLECEMHSTSPDLCVDYIAVGESTPDRNKAPGYLFIPYAESDQKIKEKIKNGAACAIVDHIIDDIPCVVVDDIVFALYKIGIWLYGSIGLETVCVAGSEGKTSTKRIINGVLKQKYKTYCKTHNWNTLQSLQCALQEIPVGTQIVVQELDESRPPNLKYCSEILRPKIAIVTNVAEAHIAALGGEDALKASFRELECGLGKDSYLILNRDDPKSFEVGFDANIITVGIKDRTADCVATNIRESVEGIEFDLSFRGDAAHVRLSVHGEQNVWNAMMAYVVGVLEGIDKKAILRGLSRFRNAGFRQNIVASGGVVVYADCYNASLTSVRAALKCFDALECENGKKIAVLGDIVEIDGYEEDTYGNIAKALDDTNTDVLITFGEKSRMIADRVSGRIEKYHTGTMDELSKVLEKFKAQKGNAFLFKASHVMHLEGCIAKVFPRHFRKMMLQEKLYKFR